MQWHFDVSEFWSESMSTSVELCVTSWSMVISACILTRYISVNCSCTYVMCKFIWIHWTILTSSLKVRVYLNIDVYRTCCQLFRSWRAWKFLKVELVLTNQETILYVSRWLCCCTATCQFCLILRPWCFWCESISGSVELCMTKCW